jgi:hypothetical protein
MASSGCGCAASQAPATSSTSPPSCRTSRQWRCVWSGRRQTSRPRQLREAGASGVPQTPALTGTWIKAKATTTSTPASQRREGPSRSRRIDPKRTFRGLLVGFGLCFSDKGCENQRATLSSRPHSFSVRLLPGVVFDHRRLLRSQIGPTPFSAAVNPRRSNMSLRHAAR